VCECVNVCVTQTGIVGHWQFSDDVVTCCFSYHKVWVEYCGFGSVTLVLLLGTVALIVLIWYSYFAITLLVFFSSVTFLLLT